MRLRIKIAQQEENEKGVGERRGTAAADENNSGDEEKKDKNKAENEDNEKGKQYLRMNTES